jgi:hypothetical protein
MPRKRSIKEKKASTSKEQQSSDREKTSMKTAFVGIGFRS